MRFFLSLFPISVSFIRSGNVWNFRLENMRKRIIKTKVSMKHCFNIRFYSNYMTLSILSFQQYIEKVKQQLMIWNYHICNSFCANDKRNLRSDAHNSTNLIWFLAAMPWNKRKKLCVYIWLDVRIGFILCTSMFELYMLCSLAQVWLKVWRIISQAKSFVQLTITCHSSGDNGISSAKDGIYSIMQFFFKSFLYSCQVSVLI